ncbi:MAG: ester cyclase [Thermomicrobiales bacterium]
MSMKAPKAIIRQWIETGLDTGEVDRVEMFFSPTYVCPGVQGIAALKRALRTMRNAFPDLHVRIEELIAEQDTVVARLAYSGTHRGTFMQRQPTGKTLNWTGVAIYRIADGMIIEEWAIWDHTFIPQLDGIG